MNEKYKKTLRLSKSVVGEAEKAKVSEVIDGAYLGMGKYVEEFETELAKYLEQKSVVCVNSGTAALHLALMGLGLEPGFEVLVQSLTFVASFQAISAAGGVPVPCEVVPETCTIDLKDAEKRITSKTKVIMPVHYSGGVGDLDEIYNFASDHQLRVVEDAAHAFGGTYKGKKIGSFGDVTCFSFDGIKNITSGEGGVVVTEDEKVLQFIKDARLLGIHRDTEKRYSGERSWEFDVRHQGYRYHMSNLFAAIGLVQLNRFENEFIIKRRELAKKYVELLSNIPSIELLDCDYTEIVPHIFPIRLRNGKRDALREHLINNGIECGIHYVPSHLLSYFGASRDTLPVTERIYSELMTLPLHPELSLDDVGYVVDTIKTFMSNEQC
jgi:dTDP-4-amino-4,6-dideoxygalactose transaminase